MTYSIKISSFYHVPFDIYEKDFTFIINNEERIQTSKIVADLLSPKISKLHLEDPTTSKFSIFTETSGDFSKVLSLVQNGNIEFSKTEMQYLSEIFQQLESEINFTTDEYEEITTDNVVDLIKQHEKSPFFFSEYINKEIDFLCDNFSSVSIENIETLSHDVLVRVLSNNKLKLDNEDCLLEIINELYSKDNSNSDLYEFVYFTNVETQTIEKFLQIFDVNDISASIWKSLSKRLKLKIEDNYQSESDLSRYTIDCPFNGEEFRGIIKYIEDQNRTNEINITASTMQCGNIANLIQFDNLNSYFHTQPKPNSWICFEFKNHRINPTHYTLRSNWNGQGSNHMKSWIVEGSNDSISWSTIDEQNNCSSINGKYASCTFTTKHPNRKGFKFIKITQNANCNGDNCLHLTAVEFYGNLISDL